MSVLASLGLPLVSPDVCPPPAASQSSRSLLPCPSQQPQPQPQPQAPPQTALLPTPQQHPMSNHMIAQVSTTPVCIHVSGTSKKWRHAFKRQRIQFSQGVNRTGLVIFCPYFFCNSVISEVICLWINFCVSRKEKALIKVLFKTFVDYFITGVIAAFPHLYLSSYCFFLIECWETKINFHFYSSVH